MKTWVRYFVCLLCAFTISIPVVRADDKPADKKPAEKGAEKTPEKADPKPDAPKTDAPKADSPKTDAPKADAPKTEAPKTDAPANADKKDESAKPAEPAKPAAPIDPQAKEKFEKKFAEWKEVLKELRALQVKALASPAESAALQTQWGELVEKGKKLLPELHQPGKAAYLASPNSDRDLARFLVKLAEDEVSRDEYEHALDLAQTLIDNDFDEKSVYAPAGAANFALGNFDKAEEYLNIAAKAKLIDKGSVAENALHGVADCKNLWAKELEIRQAEAAKNDLPRVKMTTSKGDMVIELFENEAPETVANFISLVESKFYDDKTFHRVLPGFMAQGGCPKGNGSGGPGYNIYCECKKPEARMHFRGSLSMAHAGQDTGGSQFFLTFLPTTNLNGRHTVFGRVIEGLDVLEKIQRIDPDRPRQITPDKIVKVEVLRKRDHKYEPNKVK